MILKRLALTNFMKIKACDIVFNQGINVLYGENGEGKSSILEAISFCLNERKRGDTWKEYIRSTAPSMEIHLEIQNSDDPKDIVTFNYRGIREVDTLEKEILYKGRTYLNSQCKDFIETQFDPEMIENIVFTMQDSEPINKLTPAKRKDIFKKVFSSDFEDIVGRVVKDSDLAKDELKKIKLSIDMLKSKVYTLLDMEVIDTTAYEEALKEKERLLNLIEEQKQQQALLRNYQLKKEAVATLKDYLNRDIKALSSLEEEVEKLKVYVSTAEAEKITLFEDQQTFSSDPKRQELVDINSTDLAQFAIDTENLASIDEKIIECKKNIAITKQHLETHKKGICENCGQACDVTRIDELSARVESGSATLALLFSNRKGIEFENEKIVQAKDTFLKKKNQLLSDIRMLDYKVAESKKKVDSIEIASREKAKQLEATKIKIEETHKAIDLAMTSLEIKEKEVKELASIETQRVIDYSLDLVKVNSILQSVDNKRIQNEERKNRNEETTASKERDAVEIETLSKTASNLTIIINNYSTVKSIYESDLPNFINIKVCTLLEEYMNNFLSNVKDQFQVQLTSTKKGINFFYKPMSEECDWLNPKLTSGFETSLFTLAFKNAVAHAYGSELLVLDEPDHSATEGNSVKLFQTILNMNEGYKQEVIITHKQQAIALLKEQGATMFRVEGGQVVGTYQ